VDLAEQLLAADEDGFRRLFPRSAIRRAKRAGLLRNVCVALGNWGSPEALPVLLRAVHDASPLVRAHAAWALGRIGGEQAESALSGVLGSEDDPLVRAEVTRALQGEG